MSSAADFWFNNLGKYPALNPTSQLSLFQEVRKGMGEDGALTPKAQRALNKVVSHNMRFVVKVWHTGYSHIVKSNSPQLPDLLQEGAYGLQKAALNYKPEMGYKFTTYSNFWIRRYINIWLNNRDRVVRAPQMAVHVNNRYAVLRGLHPHEKAVEMIAKHYRITTRLVMDYLRCYNNTTISVPLHDWHHFVSIDYADFFLDKAGYDSSKHEPTEETDLNIFKQFDRIACRAHLDPYERELLLAFQQGFGLSDLPKLFPDDKHVVKRYQAVRRRFNVAAKELFSEVGSLSVA